MSRVYIGNATQQVLSFPYRLPERKGTITPIIQMLAQKCLDGDLSTIDIDAIFEQWGRYGLTKLEDLESRRHKFSGILISIGKPIPYEKMKRAAIYREAVLDARGKKTREDAAITMINHMENESGKVAKHYEFSVAEEIPDQGWSNPNQKHVAEGWRVDSDQRPNMPESPTPTSRRRRAAA